MCLPCLIIIQSCYFDFIGFKQTFCVLSLSDVVFHAQFNKLILTSTCTCTKDHRLYYSQINNVSISDHVVVIVVHLMPWTACTRFKIILPRTVLILERCQSCHHRLHHPKLMMKVTWLSAGENRLERCAMLSQW